MNILVVKLSSLGDVVHAMPAVQDMRTALPGARIDWVVEPAFAPLARRCEGVNRVIGCELRRWRRAPLAAATRTGWHAFREELQRERYDAVIDLQGLTKSALVAWLARTAPGGRRFALANRTDGSSYEAPTRWVADVAVPIVPHIHAVRRSRELCARALGYGFGEAEHYGLQAAAPAVPGAAPRRPFVVLVHGSSRADKCWPREHWLALAGRLVAQGLSVALPHGSDAEEAQARSLAAALGDAAEVWPRMDLGALADRMAGSVGVIGVDSGLSHIAVALGLPHVQIYNFDTAWRTGPQGQARQRCVVAQSVARTDEQPSPTPAPEAVWQAWEQVMREEETAS